MNDSLLAFNLHANFVQIDMKNDRKTFLLEKNVFSLFDSANEVVNFQTNDILIFADQEFANEKKKSDC
jgi:hypothetical protein